MCRVLGVKRNGYYSYWARQQALPDDPLHEEMLDMVREIDRSSDNSYGYRRMKIALNILGYPVGRHKTKQLMRAAGVKVRHRKKYKVTTDSSHQQPVFANVLARQFTVAAPDVAYVGDITYVWTQEGWLYLAVVIDLYSRKVVGWSMGSRMKAQLVCDALRMALWQRRPSAGLIVHSDRGSQYASKAYRCLLKAHGFIGSMSRKGNCWDNAVAESFFGSLKQEKVQWRQYQTRYGAQQDVLKYITMFYNCSRLHSFLGYRSPMQYEAERATQWKKAA
jgi:transposase InsO family protein